MESLSALTLGRTSQAASGMAMLLDYADSFSTLLFASTLAAVKSPSVEPVLQSRLLPRISFRMMFIITTLCAVLAAIARVAGNGGPVAAAMISAAGFVLLVFAVFVALFLFAWCAAMFRVPVGMACLVLSVFLVLLQLNGIGTSVISFWPLIAFALVSGICILAFPHRDADIHADNPFADGQLPPQIMPPREKPL